MMMKDGCVSNNEGLAFFQYLSTLDARMCVAMYEAKGWVRLYQVSLSYLLDLHCFKPVLKCFLKPEHKIPVFVNWHLNCLN